MPSKKRRLYKTRTRASADSERQQLIRDTQKLINEANARLRSLERHYKTGSWASKRLRNYLQDAKIDIWTTRYGGSIKKIPTNINKTALLAIHRIVTNFLNSQTATRKGIKTVRRNQIKSIAKRFEKELTEDDIERSLTEEESESLYELFGTDSFDTLANKIGASELQVELVEAREKNDSEDDFIRRIEKYISVLTDDDLYDKVIDVYNKFVK